VTGTRRIVYWMLSTVTAVVLMFGYHTSTSGPTSTQTVIVGGPAANGSGKAGSGSTGGSSSKSHQTSSGGSASRTSVVTGSVANTQWGPVQVQLTVTGGSITKVAVLQYPNGNSTDAQINGYALPILIRETVNVQSASIDMVSGATITSTGYAQSLQSALDQAGL
jgi:uncharacterized protein with FMN-binding domain